DRTRDDVHESHHHGAPADDDQEEAAAAASRADDYDYYDADDHDDAGRALIWSATCAGGAWRSRLPHRGARLGRLLPPEHLVPPVVLVDERRDDLRPAGPPRHRHPTLLGELLEHGGAQRVQPLVLRCDLTGQVPPLGLPAHYVVLDLEKAVPVGEALLNRGHAALLLHSMC